MRRRLALVYTAGTAGGLVNSLVVWLFGLLGITTALGVAITPDLTAQWLYPRLVWGGLWGLVFMLPVVERRWWYTGFILSLLPTAAQLFWFFPQHTPHGLAGLELGLLTPLFVLGFNAVWGWVTALTLRAIV